ncbi:MAG: universal stress protein [Nocardioidaceae bacterium]
METEQQLQDVRDQLKDYVIEHEIRQLVRGMDPADDLIKVATELNAEFIVIGLRRRTPWAS